MSKVKLQKSRAIERVIDANFNRAKEGLRVCEDTARFILNDPSLMSGYKKIRHELTGVIRVLPIKNMILFRDVGGDRGTRTIISESKRVDIKDVFYANTQRVKESLRVLEEFSKLVDVVSAEKFKILRYRIYELEKKAFGAL